jgi:hypothetical protein
LKSISYVWFWTFWHWSKERFSSGAVLHSPLPGIGTYWDEWFCHEASDKDLFQIRDAGRDTGNQRQFLIWLYRHWAREIAPQNNSRLTARYVLGQLAHLEPFDQWETMERFRKDLLSQGISAIVLAEGSSGEAADIRKIEAMALPVDRALSGRTVLAEDFHAEREDLETSGKAARSLLGGKGMLIFIALWIAGGKRSFPKWLTVSLDAGWVITAGMILYLLLGPDPGPYLPWLTGSAAGLWAVLTVFALISTTGETFGIWKAGKFWHDRMQQNQTRLSMTGDLTLLGGSAGLPFSLNILHSVFRTWPAASRRSWVWRRIFERFQTASGSWAATGAVTADGFLKKVIVIPKIRAAHRHSAINHLLTPHQREAGDLASQPNLTSKSSDGATGPVTLTNVHLGLAAESTSLHVHTCHHLAQALLAIGGLFSRWQIAVNVLAVIVTVVMLFAARDLRAILLPYSPPQAVGPSSPSPNYLWVSLDTKHPRYFEVLFESDFWADRQAVVSFKGDATPPRAEIRLLPLAHKSTGGESDGTIWIQRRQCFLGRDFVPGDRVGRYTLHYVTDLTPQ